MVSRTAEVSWAPTNLTESSFLSRNTRNLSIRFEVEGKPFEPRSLQFNEYSGLMLDSSWVRTLSSQASWS